METDNKFINLGLKLSYKILIQGSTKDHIWYNYGRAWWSTGLHQMNYMLEGSNDLDASTDIDTLNGSVVCFKFWIYQDYD